MSSFENGLLYVMAGDTQRHFFFLEQIGIIRAVREMTGGAGVGLQGLMHHLLLEGLLRVALVAEIPAGSL